jgi:hypothetical protein
MLDSGTRIYLRLRDHIMNGQNARSYGSSGSDFSERFRPGRRLHNHVWPSTQSATASQLRDVSSLWESSASRGQVLQQLRDPNPMSFVRDALVGKELLSHVRPSPQAIGQIRRRHVCLLIQTMFSCIRDSHIRERPYYGISCPPRYLSREG